VTLLAIATAIGHLLVNALTPYGVHRDELLYLAMGTHLAFWRMDFPPMIAVLANVQRAVGGDSLVSIRFLPACAAGALVWLAGYSARRFGGGAGAQLLAAIAVVASPLFLRTGTLFQPVIFDQLWWTLALVLLVRIGDASDAAGATDPGDASDARQLLADGTARAARREWILLGVVMGLGLLTKFSIAFIGLAIAAALLATPMRRSLRTPWPWAAVLLTFAIGSASLVGQLRLGWPVRGQMDELRASQLVHVGMLDFVVQQFLFGPQTLLAALGAWWLLRDPAARRWRAAGASAVFAFLLLLVLRGKAYYIGPIYPLLYGAGAVALARFVDARAGAARRVALPAAAVACLLYGAVLLPVGVPVLPPARMERYVAALGLTQAVRNNQRGIERLPQDYGDMLPWKAQAAAVARVFHALAPEDRARAVVGAANYGEAGALDLYGPALGLPPVVSGAGSFWFFGPGARPGELAVVLGGTAADLRQLFDSVEVAAVVREPFAVGEEQEVPVLVARKPKVPLQAAWPALRP
jgi:hypothetical protein